ncbi:MAG: hypothetical protein ABFD49_04835 [Armatimonadota bacterium]
MRVSIILIALSISTAAFAGQTQIAPAYAVIEVTINQPISSETAKVGDRFTTICSATDGTGFPASTVFTGIVTSVIRASGEIPGQVGVAFTDATLPNGSLVNIDGRLTSMNEHDVMRNAQTGFLESRVERRNERSKFIGCSLGTLIGVFNGSVMRGGLIDGSMAWLAEVEVCADNTRHCVVTKDTRFGIVLVRDAAFSNAQND